MIDHQLGQILFSAVAVVVLSGGGTARNIRQASPAVMYGPPGFTALGASQSGGYSGSGAGCRSSNPDDNKRLVWALYENVFVNKKFDTVAEYFDTNVIEHNPMFKDGVEGQRESGNSAAGMSNFQLSDTQRMSAEGDLVWVHYRIPVQGVTFACVDIFRFNCEGKIQEHWDVCQDTNVPPANPHPFF